MNKQQHGFSLIELMIAVAIVGILAAVAYPAYTEHIREARRSDARVSLLELTQFMERYYTSNGRYTETAAADSGGPALPFTESPRDGSDKYYDLSLLDVNPNDLTATAYTIRAVPKGAMAGDTCGTLTINQAGVKGAGGDLDDCWGL
ncbi:MAG: pilus assembly protein PilE [Oceanospirillaceae bacterium]|nr:pilus assembly protein PilE [Oceanospirillaceae bacterium]